MLIRIKKLLQALFVFALLLMPIANVQACPSCREAVGNQTGEAATLKDGYYYSILMMMSMPFALMGTGAFFVVRLVKSGAIREL
jgi:hypothetical protein